MPAIGRTDHERAATWNQDFGLLSQGSELVWKLRTVQVLGQRLLKARQAQRNELIASCEKGMVRFEKGEPYTPRMSYEQFEFYLRAFVRQLRADGCSPVLMNPPRRNKTELEYPQVLPLSRIILDVAAETDTPLFDGNQFFKSYPNCDAEYFADTHHPNAKGNRLLAEEIAQFVDGLLRQQPALNTSHP
jgi:hypothetical protein